MTKYLGDPDFRHDSADCIGVLLVNLGTPDAPTRQALRSYLREFLSDPRVVELPRLVWLPILYGIILNLRPARSARAYARIWRPDGSPLLAHSQRQLAALRQSLARHSGVPVQIQLGMRYGNPSIPHGLEALRAAGARRLVVLPLYPQYSGSTVGSVFDAVTDVIRRWRWTPALHFINAYHDHPDYIATLAQKISNHWQRHGRGDHLLMSFHGLPQRYLTNGDPYYCHCHKTARLLAAALGLESHHWTVVFQSRFGREPWLQPYCDETLKSMAAGEVKNVDIVCPGFSADCLETLDEIDRENRALYLHAGGNSFNYIECLNDEPAHISMMSRLIADQVGAWFAAGSLDRAAEPTLARATALGASR